jgi:predicted transcriptional regulator
MKTESIIIRVEKEMKDKLQRLATEQRRELSDFLRIVMEDLIKKKIKIS